MQNELSDEGLQMFKNLVAYEESTKEVKSTTKTKPVKLNYEQLRLFALEQHLKDLKKNSQMVIEDCKKLMANYQTKEQYMASEPKIAKYVHERLIERIDRILEGKHPLHD